MTRADVRKWGIVVNGRAGLDGFARHTLERCPIENWSRLQAVVSTEWAHSAFTIRSTCRIVQVQDHHGHSKEGCEKESEAADERGRARRESGDVVGASWRAAYGRLDSLIWALSAACRQRRRENPTHRGRRCPESRRAAGCSIESCA